MIPPRPQAEADFLGDLPTFLSQNHGFLALSCYSVQSFRGGVTSATFYFLSVEKQTGWILTSTLGESLGGGGIWLKIRFRPGGGGPRGEIPPLLQGPIEAAWVDIEALWAYRGLLEAYRGAY